MTPVPKTQIRHFSLARMFLAAGLVVMGTAMAVVGTWVATRIETAVVQNSANAAALYMESFISPLSQDLARSDSLPGPAARALVEIFDQTPLGDRIASYKLWKPGGLVVHASDPALIGQTFAPTPHLEEAWQGRIAAGFGDLDHDVSSEDSTPLLEVYSPIRELWSGEIIAVAEFYVRSGTLVAELADARRTSWAVVGATFLSSTLALFGIVLTGDRLIRAQARELEQRVRQSEAMAALNRDLRARVVEAASRAAAQTDRFLRRLGSDLHDGPAQYLALAALRLDAALSGEKARPEEVEDIRRSLDSALAEIRSLSRGLVIPDIDNLPLPEIVARALSNGRGSAGGAIPLDAAPGPVPALGYSAKLCVYRFLQETLSNAARYAPDAACRVSCATGAGELRVAVADDGPGFDPGSALRLREDGGQGLTGLRDRAESLGGRIDIRSAPGQGTTIVLHLPIGEGETA